MFKKKILPFLNVSTANFDVYHEGQQQGGGDWKAELLQKERVVVFFFFFFKA